VVIISSSLAKKSMLVLLGFLIVIVMVGGMFYSDIKDIVADVVLTDKEFVSCQVDAIGDYYCDGLVYDCDTMFEF